MDATCTPVAPAPMTIIEGGTAVRLHASLCVAVHSKPGIGSRRLVPPALRMILSARRRSPRLSLDGVRVDEARGAGIFVDRNPRLFQCSAPGSMFAHCLDDLARAREQLGIIQDRLAHRDTIPAELFSFSKQPRCVGKYPHGNGSVIRRHTPNLAASDKNRSRTQLRSPECSEQPGWTGANDYDIHETPLYNSVVCR